MNKIEKFRVLPGLGWSRQLAGNFQVEKREKFLTLNVKIKPIKKSFSARVTSNNSLFVTKLH